jgi:hypothetical protein
MAWPAALHVDAVRHGPRQQVDGRPLGWPATCRTPVKAAHLANNPHATVSYWSHRQNPVAITAASPVSDAQLVGAMGPG